MPVDHPNQPEHLRLASRRLQQRLDDLPASHPSSGRYERIFRQAALPPDMRERPLARDVIRNIDRAEVDPRKLSEYSMNPEHPQNNGKARAWAAVGYDVASPARRRQDAHEIRDLIGRHLLADGRVAATKQTADGTDYRVVNGFTGPNGREGTLVTCWRVPPGETAGPRLLTTWLAVHRDAIHKDDGR